MAKKEYKTFTIRDLDSIQYEFFKTYDIDYWLHKMSMLKNCHDYYNKVEKHLTYDLEDIDHEGYKRMLRTELHFLYFQMIETLFEIIFAISEHDNRNLWLALTFAGDRKTEFYSDAYTKIKDFSEDKLKSYFFSEVPVIIEKKEMKVPRLRWIFYFGYPTKLTSEEWKINLDKIYLLLKMFAKDFSDRGEYNAFKHSLRFYNSPFAMGISITGSDKITGIGKSKDSITYLEQEKKDDGEFNILRTVKPFDFDRDFLCCLLIHNLIKNIINTRKYSFLQELHGERFSYSIFNDINYPTDFIPKTGVFKTSSNI